MTASRSVWLPGGLVMRGHREGLEGEKTKRRGNFGGWWDRSMIPFRPLSVLLLHPPYVLLSFSCLAPPGHKMALGIVTWLCRKQGEGRWKVAICLSFSSEKQNLFQKPLASISLNFMDRSWVPWLAHMERRLGKRISCFSWLCGEAVWKEGVGMGVRSV